MLSTTTVDPGSGKFSGYRVSLPGWGRVEVTRVLHKNSETAIYASSRPGMVVKTFDLDCGKPDEVAYGPYVGYKVELENWQDVQAIEELRIRLPSFYGSDIDYEKKCAWIAMEFLEGEDLLKWCQNAGLDGYPEGWAEEFRASLYETLEIVNVFHRHSIILIDFKPDNVIRLANGAMKFVDLGAFYTPRHSQEKDNYAYSATPDYAELVIDTSMLLTGQPIRQGADIFAVGVAMFEMATGSSRLGMADDCAEMMLAIPEIYLFRDSQIKDIWKEYPHLKELLPLLQAQLRERRILFSEFWHLLKGYLKAQMPEWEAMSEAQHQEALMSAGTNFISDQLPDSLKWLAEPIAQATTLRSFRLKDVSDLMLRLQSPISEEIRGDIAEHNPAVKMARDMDLPPLFVAPCNSWDTRRNPHTNHWAVSTRRLAAVDLRSMAPFTHLKEVSNDPMGNRFYEVVDDASADIADDGQRLTLQRLAGDPKAWI